MVPATYKDQSMTNKLNDHLGEKTLTTEQMSTRLQQTVELASEAIFWLERNGRFSYVNERACHSLGYTRAELLLMFLWDIDPDFSKERWDNQWEDLEEKEKNTFETRHRRKDGHIFPVEVSACQIISDEEEYHAAFVRDITERKAVEMALSESEERFRTLMENIPNIAVQGYALDRSVLFWNKASETLYGYSKNEAIGADLMELLIPLEMRKEIAEAFHLMNDTGESLPSREMTLKRKDGSTVPIFTSHVLNKPIGQKPVLFSFDMDLTELKQAEAERLEFETQLHQSQKIDSMGRLAGGVAHDYNNMLSVIIGRAELAKKRSLDSASLPDDLDQILQAAMRSRDITQQLLAYARKQAIAPKVLDLNVTVASMLTMLKQLLGEDIDLVWQPKEDLWLVEVDPSQLDQILVNLCVNARDAIADIGKMTIETDMVTLDQAYCHDHAGFIPGDFVMLAVSDDGCGMDKETLDKIFEPFFTTKGHGDGTGLGLSMIYGIVKQHNGFIYVYSEPNEGTTFKIYLPRHTGQVTEAYEAVSEELLKGQGETVLVVEDEAAILTLIEELLTDFGYRVLATSSPSAALDLANTHPGEIDLLITDVVMPGMNGRVLAGRLQLMHPRLKCLYMSGYTANVIAHHGVLEKGIHFIQKPFSLIDFSIHTRKALGL
jgi:PAS domain S-box-containing protein